MKVYSDALIDADFSPAAHVAGVSYWTFRRLTNTRVRARGWEISLTGSSPYTSQHEGDPHKAATWTEHGVWMADLFKIDPNARISWWNGAADFVAKTGIESPYRNAGGGHKHAAPWLDDPELMALVA